MTVQESGQTAVPADTALSAATAAPLISHPSGAAPHPRKLREPGQLSDASTAAMRYQSPLRYPGAKSGLASVIGGLITKASAELGVPELFVEPFAGGASTSLRLAGSAIVRRVLLADADPLIATFWRVAAAETNWLIDRMMDEPVTLERWDYWRAWQPRNADDRELAVKCLFLNRTTFSGILHGRAGPIGGRKQESSYKIDCRFNKEALATRLRFVGDLYRANRLVDVWQKSWEQTLGDVAEWYPQLIPNRVVVYLDPPYLTKSEKLYTRTFTAGGRYDDGKQPLETISPLERHNWLEGVGHYRLADHLCHRAQFRWILSYDDHPDLTRDDRLYAAQRMSRSANDIDWPIGRDWEMVKRLVDLRYSASATKEHRGTRQELLITTLPASFVPSDGRFRPHPSDAV